MNYKRGLPEEDGAGDQETKRNKTNMPPPSTRPGTDTMTLQDALFSADIDLADEEARLLPSSVSGSAAAGSYSYTAPPPFLGTVELTRRIRAQIESYEADVVHLISTAAKEHLMNLLSSAVVIARHRRLSLNSSSSIVMALRALASKEREEDEERRRQFRKGVEKDGEEEGQQTKARKMTEDAIAKSANVTAFHAAGGRQYSWMKGSKPQAPRPDEYLSGRKGLREEAGVTLRDLLLAMDGNGGAVMERGLGRIRD